MAIYSSLSLPALDTVSFNPKPTLSTTVKDTSGKDQSGLNDESPNIPNPLDPIEASSSTAIAPQPKASACKQCQFCSHFQLELTHWGHCSALSALVPGQATACILHEPYFSDRKTAVPLAKLQRSTINEESLKALKSNAYYQYPSVDCQS